MATNRIKQIEVKKASLYNKVYQLFALDKSTLITYDEMTKLPYLKLEDLTGVGDIVSERIPFEGSRLYFRVYMKKGSYIPIHKHNCKEKIYVAEGAFYDKKSNLTVSTMQSTFFGKDVPHEMTALEDTVLYVEFERPL